VSIVAVHTAQSCAIATRIRARPGGGAPTNSESERNESRSASPSIASRRALTARSPPIRHDIADPQQRLLAAEGAQLGNRRTHRTELQAQHATQTREAEGTDHGGDEPRAWDDRATRTR
jgi:hypothetical protein